MQVMWVQALSQEDPPQPTPVYLPWISHGQKILVVAKELDTTQQLNDSKVLECKVQPDN